MMRKQSDAKTYTYTQWLNGEIPENEISKIRRINVNSVPLQLNFKKRLSDSDLDKIIQAKKWAYYKALEMTVAETLQYEIKNIQNAIIPAEYLKTLKSEITRCIDAEPKIKMKALRGDWDATGIDGRFYKSVKSSIKSGKRKVYKPMYSDGYGNTKTNRVFDMSVRIQVLNQLPGQMDPQSVKQNGADRKVTQLAEAYKRTNVKYDWHVLEFIFAHAKANPDLLKNNMARLIRIIQSDESAPVDLSDRQGSKKHEKRIRKALDYYMAENNIRRK